MSPRGSRASSAGVRPPVTKPRRFIAFCGIGALLALAMAAPAQALTVSIEESIIWQTPSPTPTWTNAAFTGSSSFQSGFFNSDLLCTGSCVTFGSQTYTNLTWTPPQPRRRLNG
jgi:hypothetical protein